MQIQQLLDLTVSRNASDLHLVPGYAPLLRVDGELLPVPQAPILTATDTEQMLFALINQKQKDLFSEDHELDFSYAIDYRGKTSERFRVNAYFQQGGPSLSLRYIPNKIRSFEELRLPPSFMELKKLKQGFILVVGPTGHGKSTTLATIINEINKDKACHIVTIEDPIEYTYPKAKALVSQRELRSDTYSWKASLKAVLREDPDVVLIGEMRDYDTIASALTIAETGHLVFSTLHTNSSAQTIDRIIDVFPEHQQNQIRQQLAMTLSAVVCQRLVPCLEGGRIPALEVLVTTPAVRTSIREGKTHLIDNIILTSKDIGMVKLEEYFAELVSTGKVSLEVAEQYVLQPGELKRYLKK
jgi:twitching motility protein PilT